MNNKMNRLAVTKQQRVGITPIGTTGFLCSYCSRIRVSGGVDQQLQVVKVAVH